jgi:hypothetical protein
MFRDVLLSQIHMGTRYTTCDSACWRSVSLRQRDGLFGVFAVYSHAGESADYSHLSGIGWSFQSLAPHVIGISCEVLQGLRIPRKQVLQWTQRPVRAMPVSCSLDPGALGLERYHQNPRGICDCGPELCTSAGIGCERPIVPIRRLCLWRKQYRIPSPTVL